MIENISQNIFTVMGDTQILFGPNALKNAASSGLTHIYLQNQKWRQ